MSLVYLKQYLDCKSKLDGKIRESHEYIRLIDHYKKIINKTYNVIPILI